MNFKLPILLATATAENAIETIAEVTGNENLKPGVIEKYFKELPDKAFALLVKAVIAIIILIIMWELIKALSNVVDKSLRKTKIEDATAKFLAKVVKVSLDIVLLFSLASYFGMDTASLVALLGSAGVAIGLAIQGTLSDFASGILILLAKPFRVGDYIVVGGTGIEGSVTEISLINTRMLTADYRRVVMPNKTLASSTITNNNGNTMRILDTMVGISYNADIDKARAVAMRTMDANEFISDKLEKNVFVDELADSSVNLRIRGWVKPTDYLKAKWSMNEAIKKAFDKEGVEIPFPQMDVHMR
ncbi:MULTISPECIES: mechanosensitive ion channel family protein [unclassified Butyrivibrio]|uniref:mechanosensitive ion channel family protein n=1 Tax=unclassified Butyrivibrio TaxID=2639466 RepID=UPI00087FF525|nr:MULTISPECIES: mechanosensitive ion channel family protein [unclassified Butyrivibrio]SDB17221.1 small conductance mechanosensitive channel [Butyrivibrio sp. INlla16]SEK30398.1 small conductance mechanosensitive channel [Butyrivibrio sp. ob235]